MNATVIKNLNFVLMEFIPENMKRLNNLFHLFYSRLDMNLTSQGRLMLWKESGNFCIRIIKQVRF